MHTCIHTRTHSHTLIHILVLILIHILKHILIHILVHNAHLHSYTQANDQKVQLERSGECLSVLTAYL